MTIAPTTQAVQSLPEMELALSALPEFQRVDDYLLAGGASVMSDNCHQIIHIDTLEKVVEAVTRSPWACKDCGAMGHAFKTVFDHEGDSDVECLSCGSVRTDEAGAVMRYLAEQNDSETAALSSHEAEVGRLRKDAERYRFLQGATESQVWQFFNRSETDEHLNKMIDEARAALTQGETK